MLCSWAYWSPCREEEKGSTVEATRGAGGEEPFIRRRCCFSSRFPSEQVQVAVAVALEEALEEEASESVNSV